MTLSIVLISCSSQATSKLFKFLANFAYFVNGVKNT